MRDKLLTNERINLPRIHRNTNCIIQAEKYVKQKLIELKEEIDKSIIIIR
jgi:hypothetical protein